MPNVYYMKLLQISSQINCRTFLTPRQPPSDGRVYIEIPDDAKTMSVLASVPDGFIENLNAQPIQNKK